MLKELDQHISNFRKRFNFSEANLRNVMVIGTGPRAQEIIRTINNEPQSGLKILGIVDPHHNRVGQVIESHLVVGTTKDLPNIVRRDVVDLVLVVVPRSLLNEIRATVACLERMGVQVLMAIDEFNPFFVPGWQSELLGFPFLTFGRKPENWLLLKIKRLVDITVSAAGILAISPILIMAMLIVKLSSDGPIFFVQKRVGRNGKIFSLYKFRTMVEDAENRLKDLLSQNEMKGPAFKMTNDPRLTPVGGFLRKFSIDELPQLFNVLKGDMSLVGPRPPIPLEIQSYRDWHWRRLSIRPGITCFWQIQGRNKIVDFDEWAKLDLQYIDNWSLLLDFKILFMTILVVLFAKGAK